MTDRASIIEKAARAIAETDAVVMWDELPEQGAQESAYGRRDYRTMARAALDAIAPPGEAWIAPWTPGEAMIEASGFMRGPGFADVDRGAVKGFWDDMREAHLSQEPKERS